MGIMRWAVVIGSGGLAPVRTKSAKQRTADATEKQLRLQKQIAKADRQASAPRLNVTCPKCSAALVSPPGNNVKCPKCGFRMRVWATANPPAPSAPTTSGNNGTAGELERLAALHARGALSDEEFAAAKAKMLQV